MESSCKKSMSHELLHTHGMHSSWASESVCLWGLKMMCLWLQGMYQCKALLDTATCFCGPCFDPHALHIVSKEGTLGFHQPLHCSAKQAKQHALHQWVSRLFNEIELLCCGQAPGEGVYICWGDSFLQHHLEDALQLYCLLKPAGRVCLSVYTCRFTRHNVHARFQQG